MANELELTGIVKYNKSGVKAELSLSTRIDIDGAKVSENIQQVTSNAAGGDIEIGSMGLDSHPYIMIENLDDTAVLTVRTTASSNPNILTIPARTFAGPMKLESTVLKMLSSVSDSKARIIAIEP